MAIIPALDWLLARWRGGTVAPKAPPSLARRAAETRVNAELPLHKRRSAATLLGGRTAPCISEPPLAALLRPVPVPPPEKEGAGDHFIADHAPHLAVC